MEQLNIASELLDKILDDDFPNKTSELQALLNKNNLTSEETNMLMNFLANYVTINNAKLNYDSSLSEELAIKMNYFLSISTNLINACYTEPVTQAKMLMLNAIEKFAKDNDSSKEKSNTRTRMKNGINYYDYPKDISNDYNRIGGFANTVLVIASVIALGVILAIIAL